MDEQVYVPILKSKLGEFNALVKMKDSWKKFLMPLLEVTPIEYDFETQKTARSMEDHLELFCQRLKSRWDNQKCFLDTQLINSHILRTGRRCIEFIYDHFKQNGSKIIPVLHLSDDQEFYTRVKLVIRERSSTDIALRITIEDLVAVDFQRSIDQLLSFFEIDAKQVCIIFDLKAADFNQTNAFAESVVHHFQSFPYFKDWKMFVVCGGSFPPTGAIAGPIAEIDRLDWIFFNALKEKLKDSAIPRTLNYGDYGIVSASYSVFNPKTMKSSANIRYTTSQTWHVHKGKALKKKDDWKQYTQQAKEIIKSTTFSGRRFSAGDRQIYDCAKGNQKSGNPTVWNWVGHNHHFTKVIADLFSMNPEA